MARYNQQQAFRPVSGDTGAAQAAGTLAQRLGSFGDQMLNIHAEQRQSEAVTDAAKADPREPILTNNNTVYGKAYNDTLVKAHQAAIKSDYSLKLEQFAMENPGNPQGFSAKANAVREEILGQALPETRQMDEIGFDNLAQSYLNRIQSTQKTEAMKAAQNMQAQALTTSKNDIMRMIRNGDDKSAIEEFAALQDLIKESDIPESDRLEFIGEVQRGMVEQTYLDELESLPVEQAFGQLQEISKDVPDNFSPDQWDKFVSSARSLISRKKALQDGQKVAATKVDKDRVKSYLKAVEIGFPVSEEERSAAYASATRTEDVGLLLDAESVSGFSLLDANTREALLEGASGIENVNRFAGMKKAHASIKKAAEKDGMALYAKQGLAELPPFDGSVESFDQRQMIAAQASQHYGVDVAPLTKDEVVGITQSLESGEMTPQDKIQMARVFGASPKVWELFDEANANTFALAAANGKTETMSAIFKGEERIAQKLVAPISQKDYIEDFNDEIEQVYAGRDRKTVLDAALNHYYGTTDGAVYNRSDFQSSIQAVTGGIGRVNGFKLQLPQDVPESDFEDYIDGFKPEWIDSEILQHSKEEAAEKIKRSKITSVGNNQYIVETDGGVLFTREGSPYVLSFDPDRFLEISGAGGMTPQKQRRGFR